MSTTDNESMTKTIAALIVLSVSACAAEALEHDHLDSEAPEDLWAPGDDDYLPPSNEPPPEDLWAPGDDDLDPEAPCTETEQALCHVLGDIIHGAALLVCDGITSECAEDDPECADTESSTCPQDMCVAMAAVSRIERIRNCYAQCGAEDPVETDHELRCHRVGRLEQLACLLGRAPTCAADSCTEQAAAAAQMCTSA